MITIVISACLIANPRDCREHHVPFMSDIDPAQCVQYAQPHAAEWASENPGWEIKRWRCTRAAE